MDLILVRYAELGLKSQVVRKRFARILIDNMMSNLADARLEALITTEQGRIFVEPQDIDQAVCVIKRVMGVASLSSALHCKADMETMKRVAAEYSKPLYHQGQSFAIRARRTGEHSFTSNDVGREVGSAVWVANEDKGPRVDLTRPDVEIFVEVRDRNAYIFSEYVPGPGGLPMSSQGRVMALLERERDALAAWLIMKRGCRIIAIADEENEAVRILRRWDADLRVVADGDLAEISKKNRALATVFGYGLDDFKKIKSTDVPVPAFFPLVGMSDDEIEERLRAIKQ
jgi:thiamine biosynthesis protein ThiI